MHVKVWARGGENTVERQKRFFFLKSGPRMLLLSRMRWKGPKSEPRVSVELELGWIVPHSILRVQSSPVVYCAVAL